MIPGTDQREQHVERLVPDVTVTVKKMLKRKTLGSRVVKVKDGRNMEIYGKEAAVSAGICCF
jgi:hypothetical protein